MKVFVGGATGATGQAFVPAAVEAGLEVVPHVRPASVEKYRGPPDPAVFDLADQAALDAAMAGVDAVVSLIGTTRKRFAQGDTYETSDVGTTRLLVDAACRAGVRRFVLLSALGSERGMVAYARAKQQAEEIVRGSGIAWTVVRPSFLVGNGRSAPGMGALGWFRGVPGLTGWADDVRPIPVEVVARALVHVVTGGPDGVLLGRDLWRLGG